MKLVAPLDANKNEIRNAAIQNLAAAPSSPVVGQIYFDTVLGYHRQWDGAAWQRGSFANDPYNRSNHTGTQTASTISDFAATAETIRLDQFAQPTAPLNHGGQRATNAADPTSATDLATMQWVQSQVQGQTWKNAVRAATTAALATNTRSGNVLTASANGALAAQDGVTLAVNDSLLVKNEATGANNGIYVVTQLGDAGTPWILTRRNDADTSAKVTEGLSVEVAEGTTYADKAFTLTTDAPITLNTTALTFTQGASSTTYTAGNGLSLTGNTFAVVPGNGVLADGTSTRVDPAVVARKYTALIGDGSSTTITVTHGLGNQWVTVQTFDASTGAQVQPDPILTGVNTLTLTFTTAPASGAFRVVVIG